MNDFEFVTNAYNKSFKAVSEEIQRQPNKTEEALMFATIILTIKLMGAFEKPANVMGRATAMSLFRFITFDADEEQPSITNKYREDLGLSQKDLDIQVVKAIEKAHHDPIYDSSTIRTLIMSARSFCYELKVHELIQHYDSYREFSDSVLGIIIPILADNLRNKYLGDPNIVRNAKVLMMRYMDFAIETDDPKAMLIVS